MNISDRHDRAMEVHAEQQERVLDTLFKKIDASNMATEKVFRDMMHELGKLTGWTEKKG